jgi:hypothetical protein
MKNTQFFLIATAILLLVSCGCIFKPKTVEPLKKENITSDETTLATGCQRPYAKIGDECCRDENDNRICDLDETGGTLETLPEDDRPMMTKQVSSTQKISSTTSSPSSAPSTTAREAITSSTVTPETVSITSTTQLLTNSSSQCALNADCGAAYYGSCICSNSNVVQTKYIPMCLNGVCKWRSKSETLTCKRIAESSDEAKNNASERCIIGYGRCITNEEYNAFLTLKKDTTVIEKVYMESFSRDYNGYSFRNKKAAYYASESRCYENLYFIVEVKDPAGEMHEIEIAWNKYTAIGTIQVKVGGILKDIIGKDNPILWVKEA